jgi:cytochrome c556
MKKLLFLRKTALIATATLCVASAGAFTVADKDAIKFRQSAFFLISNVFGEINGMAQGRIPMNEAVLKERAELLNALVAMPFHAFPQGSDKGQTKAKSEIWSEADKFKKAAADAQAAVSKLNSSVAAGQTKDLKALAGDVGKACKSCHDQFRS